MKGSVFFQKDRKRWAVGWPMNHRKGSYVITRYKGEFMYHESIARKCLSRIQDRWEQHQDGLCQFQIEEFLGRGRSNVPDYYEEWMKEVIEPKRKPATIKGYWSYWRNWIRPFFEIHKVMLHEVQLDTLTKLMNYCRDGGLSGKGAFNVINALHSIMDYAWRSRRIPEVPPFPKYEDYDILPPKPDCLTKAEFRSVFSEIPEINRPPFIWIYAHFRRLNEACALYKTDYDPINNSFIIQRTISARKLVSGHKTNRTRRTALVVACVPEFTPIARRLLNENPESPFLFVNPRARKDGKRYTLEALRNIWYPACDRAGVRRIKPYPGTKHTGCAHYLEDGGTVDGLQILTQHANRKLLTHYQEITLKMQRDARDLGALVDIKKYKTNTSEKTRKK